LQTLFQELQTVEEEEKAGRDMQLFLEQHRTQPTVQPTVQSSGGCFCGLFGKPKSGRVQPATDIDEKEVPPSALWDAASVGNLAFVENLMERQVNTLSQDDKGHTALHMAAEKGHVLVLRAIVKEGGLAVLMVKNKNGRTAKDIANFFAFAEANDELIQLERELINQRDAKIKREQLSVEVSDERVLVYNQSAEGVVLTTEVNPKP
jgi:hypothetical protein